MLRKKPNGIPDAPIAQRIERTTQCLVCMHKSADHGMTGLCMVDGCDCTAFRPPPGYTYSG